MLSKRAARRLVFLYRERGFTGPALAQKFKISVARVYQILHGKRQGVLGLEKTPRDYRQEDVSQVRGGTLFRKCCVCEDWKEATKENFYFQGKRIKYGRCKGCHIRIEVEQFRQRRKRAREEQKTA